MSSMDGGRVDIDLNLGTDGLKRGVAEAKRQIRDLDKNLKLIDQMRRNVPADVFSRSIYAQDLRNIEAQRAGLMRIVDAEKQATSAARERSRMFGVLGGGGNMGRIGRLGIVGLAANRAGANISELSQTQGDFASRMGGFVQSLTQLDVVGAVKAAQMQIKLTDEQIQKLGTDLGITSPELDKLTAGLATLGQSDAADKIREIRNELVALNALNFASRGTNVTVVGGANVALARGTAPNDIGGMQGPGAVAASNALVTTTGRPDTRAFGLTDRLKTAIAASQATGTDRQQLAQLRRARSFLQGQLAGGGLQTAEAKQAVYGQLAQVRSQIDAWTKDTVEGTVGLTDKLRLAIASAGLTSGTADDMAALRKAKSFLQAKLNGGGLDVKKRLEIVTQLGQVQDQMDGLIKQATLSFEQINPAGVLGGLGAGPFLQSPVVQFAQGFGYKPGAKDFLRDIRSQVNTGSAFAKNLQRLRKRGLGQAAVGELAGMGLGASLQVAALAGAPTGLIRAYSRQAERREQVAQRIQTMTAQIHTASIVIQNGRVIGVDRNGNGALDPRERFSTTAAGR